MAQLPFEIQCIDHVEVVVRDLDAAIRWYAEVLGLQEICRWDPYPVMIGAGGTMLALFQAEPGAEPPARATPEPLWWRRVAWRTDAAGFAAAQEHLRKLSVRFHGPVDHGRSHSIYFSDPDGHPLEITHDVAS